MSDHLVHACNGCDGKSGEALHTYHSVWMSHWTRRSCDSVTPNHNISSTSFGNKQNCYAANDYLLSREKAIESNSYSPAKETRGIETGNFNFINENFRTTSTTLGTKKLAFQSFPTDGPGTVAENVSAVKNSKEICDMKALRPRITSNLDSNMHTLSLGSSYMLPPITVTPDVNKIPSRECDSGSDELLQINKEPGETSRVFRDSSFVISRPFLEELPRSSNHMVQCGIENGDDRIPVLPLARGKPLPTSEERVFERENFDYQRQSTFLVCEEKVERHSKSARSLTSFMRQNKASLFQMDPRASNNHLPIFGGEQFRRMQNLSGISLFQNRSNLQEPTSPQRLYHGSNSLRKFSESLQDVETMRICTTVDSVVPLHGDHPRFSQTTQSWLITKKKKTDLNSFKEKQTYTSSRECTGLNGNTFFNFQSLSPFSSQQGAKIQSLGESTDTEGKENVGDVNTSGRFFYAEDLKALGNSMKRGGKKVVDGSNLKNESSAETDTMDLDELKEKNQLFGANSSPPNKDLRMSLITPQVIIGSTGEAGHRRHSIKLPDINLELPALPSGDNVDPSSSRTQSLDMETLLAHAEQPSQSESDCYAGGSSKPEPSNRWIKRLRLSASESFSLGTKSSNMGKESCHEKSNLSSGKILKGSVVNSEPTVSKLPGKELMVLDDATALRRYGESSSTDAAKKGKDTLTSPSWIRRWCHNQSGMPQKKPDAMVVFKPQSSKLASEDLQDKQCPSIAAMALMGKAMNGFQTCEFRRRGSFIVWNTRGL
ncbi:uncharacterized protein LOC113762274 [Coffea eugenioides]|uniref:uncharacterized protein LOC113762274 n=1 Tax=Coffea eugenioides TaxID=49369 RepID=UPI000F613F99|nr:uncharacterized protein LOC113762274 [Coffea eugenioides]XP_027161453.1 uncharacterized protein LOC113762274 [Coffea eugenioides]XP_027161454.1 uncharacterized protein LOC113762274 [Coffea eugenioides]